MLTITNLKHNYKVHAEATFGPIKYRDYTGYVITAEFHLCIVDAVDAAIKLVTLDELIHIQDQSEHVEVEACIIHEEFKTAFKTTLESLNA
jgi:hypothetical protein